MVDATIGDPCDSMSRDEIKNYLCDIAERHIQASHGYNIVRTDESKDLKITSTTEAGIPLTICTMKGEGLSVDDFRGFCHPDTFPDNLHILDPILTCKKMEDIELDGCYAMYQHIKTPKLLSNRCTFTAVYNIDLPNGGFICLTTSKGMKAIEQYKTGKDVLAHTLMTYNKVEPCEDGSGCRVTSVLCVNPAGKLPAMVKTKIAKSNSNTASNMVWYLRDQKGLEE